MDDLNLYGNNDDDLAVELGLVKDLETSKRCNLLWTTMQKSHEGKIC